MPDGNSENSVPSVLKKYEVVVIPRRWGARRAAEGLEVVHLRCRAAEEWEEGAVGTSSIRRISQCEYQGRGFRSCLAGGSSVE